MPFISLNLFSFQENIVDAQEHCLDNNLAYLNEERIRLPEHASEDEILFFLACSRLDIPQIKLMLERNPALGSSQDVDEKTPLHFLIDRHDGPLLLEAARLFLDQDDIIEACDSEGKTPLCYACDNRKWDMAYLLLDHNANVNIQTACGIPLHTIIKKEHKDLIETFIQKGARDLKDAANLSSLHHACEAGNIEITELILKNLYNLDLTLFKNQPCLGREFNLSLGFTDTNHDVLSTAIECRNLETTKLLLEYHIAKISTQHLFLPLDSDKVSFDIFNEIITYINSNDLFTQEIIDHLRNTLFVYFTCKKSDLNFNILMRQLIDFINIDYFHISADMIPTGAFKDNPDAYNEFISNLKQQQLYSYKAALKETGFKRIRKENKIPKTNKYKKTI